MKAIFLLASTVMTSAAPNAEQLFTMNCAACHLPDQMVVGPSLAEMRTLYLGKPDDFVKWAIAPEQKRKNVIEMPSMRHLGEDGLRAIYEHVMKVSEGVEMKKEVKGDPFASSPTQLARPQVQRMFMPEAGPAALAIALDDETSLCWDAGECRLRYAWTGGFIDGYRYWKGNGSSQAKIDGTVRYVEKKSPFGDAEVEFRGYGLKKGLPVLRYRTGGKMVTETFAALEGGEGFTRTFTMTEASEKPLVLEFPTDQEVSITSDKGEWDGGKLTLDPANTTEFTIKFSLK